MADANFSAERLQDVYSAELVNTLGNSASRVTAMIEKYFAGVVPPETDAATATTAATAAGVFRT